MTTDQQIDPSETTSTDVEPLSPSESEPSEDNTEETTETTEELKEKLAAAETEAKRWKGRVEKANEKKAKEPVTSEGLAELEWKLENKDRISLVKDEYDKLLVDGYQGETVSKKVALELAEKLAKVDSSEVKRKRQDDMTVTSTTNRDVGEAVELTEYDKRLGITAESKAALLKEYPELGR